MPDVLEPISQHRPGTFTAESARTAAAKSVAARIAKAQRKLAPAAAPLQAPLPTVDDYTRLRLVCVREQLGLVDRAILLESAKDHPDGQRLNWLASAQERLAEQERLLAGRPLPGSRKPLSDRPGVALRGRGDGPGSFKRDSLPAIEYTRHCANTITAPLILLAGMLLWLFVNLHLWIDTTCCGVRTTSRLGRQRTILAA